MITTNVGAGNFFVKSKDPSKGWSEPIYLKKIDGIDPSFFFDDNGKGYIVHNGPVVGGADYEGQRAIRCFEFDVKGDSIKGDFKEILRGGTHVEARPIWIEGPSPLQEGQVLLSDVCRRWYRRMAQRGYPACQESDGTMGGMP